MSKFVTYICIIEIVWSNLQMRHHSLRFSIADHNQGAICRRAGESFLSHCPTTSPPQRWLLTSHPGQGSQSSPPLWQETAVTVSMPFPRCSTVTNHALHDHNAARLKAFIIYRSFVRQTLNRLYLSKSFLQMTALINMSLAYLRQISNSVRGLNTF